MIDKIKDQIEKIVDKIKEDPEFKKEFMKDPEKAIEKVTGIDIPDGMIDKVVDGVMAKIGGDKLSDAVDSLKGLFDK